MRANANCKQLQKTWLNVDKDLFVFLLFRKSIWRTRSSSSFAWSVRMLYVNFFLWDTPLQHRSLATISICNMTFNVDSTRSSAEIHKQSVEMLLQLLILELIFVYLLSLVRNVTDEPSKLRHIGLLTVLAATSVGRKWQAACDVTQHVTSLNPATNVPSRRESLLSFTCRTFDRR